VSAECPLASQSSGIHFVNSDQNLRKHCEKTQGGDEDHCKRSLAVTEMDENREWSCVIELTRAESSDRSTEEGRMSTRSTVFAFTFHSQLELRSFPSSLGLRFRVTATYAIGN
jgi:hypothetical protein